MWLDYSSFPPATRVARPERRDQRLTLSEKVFVAVVGRPQRLLLARKSGLWRIVRLAGRRGGDFAVQTDDQLRGHAEGLRLRLAREGFGDALVAEVFALVREAAGRTLGMRHFDCQLLGGLVLLKGMVAEMETGEGKTLTATLAVVTAALAGLPVHVISVNDYLTRRDADGMAPVYRFFGLSVGCIVHGLSPSERRAAYDCDITYCTNKEIVFDYLRDRMTLGALDQVTHLRAEALYDRGGRLERLLMRGLVFAIVDEADSVLVDEARTPLIISGSKAGGDEEQNFLLDAMTLAAGLDPGTDFRLDLSERHIELTEQGRQTVHERSESLGPLWSGTVRREEMVRKALSACHLFQCDEHYLVHDGKVQIVDEFTGRMMPDRSWERGLQQLIELKEGGEVTRPRETLSRISYQRFFRRYRHLAGMTGTAREVAGELWSVYRLPMVRVPTHRPCQRIHRPDRVWPKLDAKWLAVVERVRELHAEGRPVLVGTRTVAASELLSRLFATAGLSHEVINARREEEEAEIVVRAGESGRITIATNMAGRGTDIKLGEDVGGRGGLHVLLTERHEAARIDRQLEGRCARQGDPGSFEAFVSLQDPILAGPGARLALWLARLAAVVPVPVGWLGQQLVRRAQRRLEKNHARIRRELLKQDERRGTMLSFSGRPE
jgi:preprotein translocase subunit SecA